MEKLSSDILEDDFIKIFEPIHWVQYLAGFHRVNIQHKYVTSPSMYYKIYSCILWILNVIAIVHFEFTCEIKLGSMSNVYAFKTCEFLIISINAVVAYRNNVYDGILNSQIYVKLQKMDRIVKMQGVINSNRKLYLLSVLSTIVILLVWCLGTSMLNITATQGVCPTLLFVQFFTVATYMENILAAAMFLFLTIRLNHVNSTLEREAKRMRDANMSLTADQHYREKEQDNEKLVVAIYYILDCWTDFIRLFQFQILSFTVQVLTFDFVIMLSVVTMIRDKDSNIGYLAVNCVIFLLAMTSIFTLSFLSTTITSKMRITRSICFNVLSMPGANGDKLQKNAQHILMLLETTSPCTIYDIYTVDNRLPLHIFAITATYTIVLLQFSTL